MTNSLDAVVIDELTAMLVEQTAELKRLRQGIRDVIDDLTALLEEVDQ